MRLRIDPHSGEPLGLQIVRQLKLAIASGRVAPGERLPSARELAEDLQVNFHTVRKAYGDLEHEGVVNFRRGLGTFVRDDAPSLDARALKKLIRNHVDRLVEDLAGTEISREKLVELFARELDRALGARRKSK